MQITPEYQRAFARVVQIEGGYADHPSDPGGPTMYGVTERVARAHGYVGSMQALPLDVAKEIYFVNYWLPAGCDRLSEKAAFDVFDSAVNHGVSQAVKFAQRALRVKDDGVIGPVTIAAIRDADPAVFSARFNGERLRFYTDLGTFGAFGKGWVRRVAENLRTA